MLQYTSLLASQRHRSHLDNWNNTQTTWISSTSSFNIWPFEQSGGWIREEVAEPAHHVHVCEQSAADLFLVLLDPPWLIHHITYIKHSRCLTLNPHWAHVNVEAGCWHDDATAQTRLSLFLLLNVKQLIELACTSLTNSPIIVWPALHVPPRGKESNSSSLNLQMYSWLQLLKHRFDISTSVMIAQYISFVVCRWCTSACLRVCTAAAVTFLAGLNLSALRRNYWMVVLGDIVSLLHVQFFKPVWTDSWGQVEAAQYVSKVDLQLHF